MSEWISTKDKLPGIYTDVWVYIPNYGVRIAYITEEIVYADGKEWLRAAEWNVTGWNYTLPLKKVTHWMPLPEPPKEPNLE